MPPLPLPKPGSQAARALWDQLKAALDLPRSIVVLEGALDRKTLDDALQKATRGALGRVSSLTRAEVVARLADLFHAHEETATALLKELDKSSHKERHIVASIDEGALTERLRSYRALDFRRERARLIWALLRDGRAACFAAAGRILDETFAALAARDDDERALVASGATDVAAVEVVRERLGNYEAAIAQQQKELQREVGQKESVERERAELVARLGSRENALRLEEQLRRDTSTELARATETIARLEGALRAVDASAYAAVLEENERLKERVRTLERAADRAGRVVELEAQLADLRRDELQRQQAQARAASDADEQLRLGQGRERAALARVDELREQLREARLALSHALTHPTGHGAGPTGRVAIFVDDANLSASARRDLGSRLDYRELLSALTDGRPRSSAVAFVVDSPDTPRAKHDAFVGSLRTQGWDVREKRAKVRQDGSRKADWDMGMAMEILDGLGDFDTVVIGSGDGDFVPLVRRLQREKKRVEVAAFRASTDEALIAAADGFVGLDGRFRLA